MMKRRMILSEMEGFSMQNTLSNLIPFRSDQQKMDSEMESVITPIIGGIGHFVPPANVSPLRLRDLCILSSYNTAVTGNYVNMEMIKHVLERGFRLIDFEIFAKDNQPYVGKTTNNQLRLLDIFDTIITSAFTSPCPNYNDPLFVHLRIHPNDINKEMLYKNIQTILTNNQIRQLYYKSKITSETTLSSLAGRLVVIMNSDDKVCEKKGTACNDIIQVTGITSNSVVMAQNVIRTTEYYKLLDERIQRPTVNKKNMTANLYFDKLQFVIPDSGSNPELKPLICSYGIQMAGYQVHKKDTRLYICEKAFNENKSAFVPMAIMIPYLESPAYDELTK